MQNAFQNVFCQTFAKKEISKTSLRKTVFKGSFLELSYKTVLLKLMYLYLGGESCSENAPAIFLVFTTILLIRTLVPNDLTFLDTSQAT